MGFRRSLQRVLAVTRKEFRQLARDRLTLGFIVGIPALQLVLFGYAIDLGLPLSFHILTSQQDTFKVRGPKLNAFMSIIRGCQDLVGTFVLGGVFERHPRLRLVCVEADAGWVPHFMYRMDHAYDRHRYWLPSGTLTRMPSEYFREHVYTTFQDDWVAFQVKDLCNIRRLLWANDYPHSDATWPWSRNILAEQARGLTEEQRRWLVHDNVKELYKLPVG